jgi:hypothetical protein
MRFGFGSSIGGVAMGASGGAMQSGATSALALGFAKAIAYEDAINSTAVTQKFGTEEQHRYAEAIMAVSKRTGQSPALLAQLSDELAKAGAGGHNAANRVKNLTVAAEGWAEASVVAGDGMQRLAGDAGAIGRMTGLMVNNFNLSGDKLKDTISQLARVSNDTTLDLNNMVMALSKIAPEVAAAGGSFSDALLLATISARSGKSPSLIGGQGASFLKDIRDPKKQGKLNAVGIQTEGLSQTVIVSQVFEKYLNAKTQQEKDAIVNAIGRYGQGIVLALNGMDAAQLEQTRRDVSKGGTLNADYLRRQEAMKQKLSAFAAAWERFIVRLSEAGIFDLAAEALEYLGGKLETFATWVKENKKEIAFWLPILLKVIGFLWLFGKVLSFVSLLSGASRLAMLTSLFSRFAWVLRVVWVALGWIVAGIAAVLGIPAWVAAAILAAIAALATAIWYYWDDIKRYASIAWEGIKSAASVAWEWIKTAASSAWDAIKNAGASAWQALKDAAWAAISSMFGWLTNLGSRITGAWNSLKGYAADAGRSLASPAVGTGMFGAAGMAMGAPLGGTTVHDNRRFNFNGNGDQYLRRTAGQIARGEVAGSSHRRNSRR